MTNSSAIFKKSNMSRPYISALLDTFLREMKTCVYPKTCRQMFIAVLFTIVPNWKQPNYPSTGEWVNKLWYSHTMDCYPKGTPYIGNNMDESSGVS